MDGLHWRVAVTAIVISMLMVSQCAGSARVAAAKPYNAQYREEEIQRENALVAEAAATTEQTFPANPYVFSAEDYDALQQNAEGARSIVSYEPQRIDAKRSSSEMSLDWSTSPLPPTSPLAAATQERKLYEVPRKRSSRPRDVSATNETSLTHQSTANQRRRGISTKPQLQTPDQRRRSSEARRRQRSRSQRQEEIMDQEAAGMMIVLNDRIPRPFGFTTPTGVASNPTVSSRRKSAINAPTRYYETVEPSTTQNPPIFYTIPKRRRALLQPTRSTTATQESYPTVTTYQTINVPLKRHHTEQPTVVPVQQTTVYTELPAVEESDYDEPPTEDAVSAKDDDRREYNYSHVERYEEPLEPTRDNEQPDEPDQASDQIAPVAEVQDLLTEGDRHHKAHEKPNHRHEGGEEGEEGASAEHGKGEHHEEADKSHKGYKDYHEHEDAEKGHHVKEGHDHHYDEKDGEAKKHHDEAGYHEKYEKGEEGEKKAVFHEKSKHNKGHSTKGEHIVHKKDEFEKKIEFYDESHEGGDDEKEGAHHHEHHHKKGHHYKKDHHHKGHDEAHKGLKGHHQKGHHHHTKKGHSKEEDDEHHHHHQGKYGKKGGNEDSKHWHHRKGKRR